MNIGLISVNNKPTSVLSEGGTEVFTANLATELIKRGNKVYIFGCKGSYVENAHHIDCTEGSRSDIEYTLEKKKNTIMSNDELQTLYYVLCMRNIYFAKQYEKIIDIFHDNTSSPVIQSILDIIDKPIVSSLHMPVDKLRRYSITYKYLLHKNVQYIATSKYQQKYLGFDTKLIYNGIPLDKFASCTSEKKKHISWIGRIDQSANKGLDDAIIASKATGHKLIYRAFIEDSNYYINHILPLLDDNCVKVDSFKTDKEKVAFYKSAKILINPIKWEEPFGLTMIEALASGTPVIAYARGAVPEIMIDGETGFIVNSSDAEMRGEWMVKETGVRGLINAIDKIYSMKDDEYSALCEKCKEIASYRYSIKRMVDEYVELYKSLCL